MLFRSKLATLGLDDAIRQQKPASVPQTAGHSENNAGATNKKAGNDPKSTSVGSNRELTEQEKREAQLRSDAAAAMDLFGIAAAAERKEPTFEDLRSKADFQSYAEKLGEQMVARSSDPQYLFFVNSLVDQLTKPMNKLQLQTVRDTVQAHLDVILKREDEQQKRKVEQLKQKETKKTKKNQVKEDYVEGEYDDYDEQFNKY